MVKKILVVDDEPYMIRLMKHHLTRAGFDMISAANGEEAIEKAVNELPHLVIMDVMMARMDGLAALKELKSRDETRRIPVIMLTANARLITRLESESSGAAAFITKPFSPTRLMAEIQRLLSDVPEAA